MNGPAHFSEAERLLGKLDGCVSEDHPCAFCTEDIAVAQVHATLALAAAFADPYGPDEHVWREVLS